MNTLIASSARTGFTRSDTVPGALSASAAASLLAAVGDVTFILSTDGTIIDVAVSQGELANHGFTGWIGEAWADTMTSESRTKVSSMLSDAQSAEAPRWRQVNHAAAGGDVPVRYLIMTFGDGDRLIAVGRDMRGAAAMQQRLLQTQQSLERDYIRLRQAETRYRLLFDMASDAVLIVDADTRRIREANPAAHRLLDAAEGTLVSAPVASTVDARDRDNLVAYLGAAEAADDLAPITVRLAENADQVRISARLFRQARQPLLILQLSAGQQAVAGHRYDATLSDVVERMPDSFVLVDRELTILTANAAFVELAEMPSVDRVVGARLSAWLGRPGIDLELIVAQLREHGSVRNVATILRGTAGAQAEIEVSGVVAPMAGSDCYGFTIRHVGRRLREAPIAVSGTPRSVEQLTELVGRMSLKDIVRESTDLIERLCIEAALAYTSDNRASAAEVLGVSRQSLYSKLHRHGLGNLVSGEG
ncbi:transcriptional regulator PpsR [Sphingomonas sp. PB2P19]|uniref:transcriptional regulator PpsR n=1 Tax=Sphingomonas rhamnosi TaxID=3096156 RepID=UPI002FC5ACF9